MSYCIIFCDITLTSNLKSKNKKINGKENKNKNKIARVLKNINLQNFYIQHSSFYI